MDDITEAWARLNDAICNIERSTGQQFTVALIPHGRHIPVLVCENGKPVRAGMEHLSLANALVERFGGL